MADNYRLFQQALQQQLLANTATGSWNVTNLTFGNALTQSHGTFAPNTRIVKTPNLDWLNKRVDEIRVSL